MYKLIVGIAATTIFIVLSKIVFEALYSYNIIAGVLKGPYVGFLLLKFYSILLLLFCLYKLRIHKDSKSEQKEWLPLSIFALLITAFCFIFLNF